jgi:serine/threonine-protein kinase
VASSTPTVPPPLAGLPDAAIFGPYRIVRALGAGGMGTVYLARHVALDREVALKVLSSAFASDPDVAARFRREAECASRLSHPGLVKLYDYGLVDGVYYISMEYVAGKTLVDVIRSGGALPVSLALSLVRQVLEAIACCHGAGLVHRDIKPSNVMVDAAGRARVLDLGLVKPLNRTAMTAPGAMLGTPSYVPPELILCEEVDYRGDLYQIGLLLYECLAGRPAYTAPTLPELLRTIANLPPPPLPRLPAPVADLVSGFLDRTLAKRCEDRFSSCEAALAYLDAPPRPAPRSRADAAGAAASGTASRSTARLGVELEGDSDGARDLAARRGGVGIERRGAAIAAAAIAALIAAVWFLGPAGRARSPAPDPGTGPADLTPLDVAFEIGPTSVAARWTTHRPAIGALSLEGSAVVTREIVPATRHRFVLGGLPPGRSVSVAIVTPDGHPLDRWTGRLPSVGDVVDELVATIATRVDEKVVKSFRKECRHVQGFPAAIADLKRAWRRRCARMFDDPTFRSSAARYRSVRDLVPESLDVAPASRCKLVRALEDLRDLDEILREAFGGPSGVSGLELLGAGNLAHASLPAGVSPLFALRFGDGGRSRGRAPLPDDLRPITVPQPCSFSAVDVELLAGTALGQASRFDYVLPIHPAPHRTLRSAWLRFRVFGGRATEKLAVAITTDLDRREADVAAFIRGAGRDVGVEGHVRIDERLLADRAARLVVFFEHRSVPVIPAGIVADHLVLYGEGRR